LNNTLYESPSLEDSHLLPLEEWRETLANGNQIFELKTEQILLNEI
jgi:hypothetical protein